MGWASATYIFNSVADQVVREVQNKYLSEPAATRILSGLAAELMSGDWDTVDEAMMDYQDVSYVLDAFEMAGVDRVDVNFYRNFDQYADDDLGMYKDE